MITLSPKYGVNPCIPKCLYCGKDKNEIRLFGRVRSKKYARDDIQMPIGAVVDTIPCEACTEKFSSGVICTEVFPAKSEEEKRHPHPTGRYFVVKPEVFNGKYSAGQIIHIPVEVFSRIFNDVLKEREGKQNA